MLHSLVTLAARLAFVAGILHGAPAGTHGSSHDTAPVVASYEIGDAISVTVPATSTVYVPDFTLNVRPMADISEDQPRSIHTGPEEDEPGWDCSTMGNRWCGDVDRAPVDTDLDVFAICATPAGDPFSYTGPITGYPLDGSCTITLWRP